MAQYVKRLRVVGLYGRFDIDIGFSPGVNIVHGANGTGKTTMLHILANATNLDLPKFAALTFRNIDLEIGDGPSISFARESSSGSRVPPRIHLLIDDETRYTWPDDAERFTLEDDSRHRRQDPWAEVRERLGLDIDPTYFPAFRTMREAWSSLDLQELIIRGDLIRRSGYSTNERPRERGFRTRSTRRRVSESEAQAILTREIFGDVVPAAEYPSPRDIQGQLDDAIQIAVNRLAAGDRSLLSDAFSGVFAAISGESESIETDARTPEEIRAAIAEQMEQLQILQSEYGLPESNIAFGALRLQVGSSATQAQGQDDTTTRVLRVYEDALRRREQNLKRAFCTVRTYIDGVNHFLNGKQLVTTSRQEHDPTPQLWIRHNDGTLSRLDTLSSGERQIAGLIYAATHLAAGSVVLVDEPELSLHVDWQRAIIGAMVKQLPEKQLIVCTHSPAIGSAFMENMVPLIPTSTDSPIEDEYDTEVSDDAWVSQFDLEDA